MFFKGQRYPRIVIFTAQHYRVLHIYRATLQSLAKNIYTVCFCNAYHNKRRALQSRRKSFQQQRRAMIDFRSSIYFTERYDMTGLKLSNFGLLEFYCGKVETFSGNKTCHYCPSIGFDRQEKEAILQIGNVCEFQAFYRS